jgi:hypothetical protein
MRKDLFAAGVASSVHFACGFTVRVHPPGDARLSGDL